MSVQVQTTNKLIKGRAGRGRNGKTPLLIVLHIQEGYNDLQAYFSSVQADCTICTTRSGELQRLLLDTDTAWTNGDWYLPNLGNPIIKDLYSRGISTNEVSLTIEHQGFAKEQFPEVQLLASARMCAYWCEKYNIPPDRNHIVGHYEVGAHKGCPGPNFPFDKFIKMVKAIYDSEINKPVITTPETIPVEKNDGSINGFWVIEPLRKAYDEHPDTGLPITGMVTAHDDGLDFDGLVQYTERDRWEAHKNSSDGYDIHRGKIGAEFLELRKELAKLKNIKPS